MSKEVATLNCASLVHDQKKSAICGKSMGAGFYENTNGVPLENGRVHHLGLAPGEVANRVVSVGSLSRATLLRGLLDAPGFELTSARGFTTFTSTYGGVPVSVVATGMGGPMMDFVVRETRAVTAGPMSFVRLGSCGGVSEAAAPGVVVANTPGSVAVSRNLDHDFSSGDAAGAYVVTERPAAPDGPLAAAVAAALAGELGEARVLEALNASATSFYDAQGRDDPAFRDDNGGVLASLRAKHARVASMEMESFTLLHLAACCDTIKAATCAVVAANRVTGAVVDTDAFRAAERASGVAVLKAITAVAP